MRGMSWCSDSVDKYLFSSSTRCLCVFAPPSRFRRSSSWRERELVLVYVWVCDYGLTKPMWYRFKGLDWIGRTLFRLISSWRRCASVLPVPVPAVLGVVSRSGSEGVFVRARVLSDGAAASDPPDPATSSELVASGALSLELLLFLLFFLIPASFAPLSFRPPDTADA
jgi:hypothetical protein